jgi:undecaprenyl-diphosphatase
LVDFDKAVDDAADAIRGGALVDRFFYTLTESANHSILWHSMNLLANRKDKRALLQMAAVLGVESALVNGGIKQLFKRARPAPVLDRPHRLRNPKTTSFPSGHATSAFCAATLLSTGKSPAQKAAWYSLAALVSYSRIHVRLHHATDVVGGIGIGLVFGRLARRLLAR